MRHALTRLFRTVLPPRYQLPVNFMYRLARGNLEKEMGLLGDLVRPGDRVIDVGGNRGMYAYRLWKLGARVEVFEPNPVCVHSLETWANGKSRINVHAVALSAAAGEASLRIPVDDEGVEHDSSASVEDSVQGRVREQPVALRSLDSYGFKDVALIKIDVEGHESSVIAGAAETLAASRPALIVEIEQRHSAKPIADIFGQITGSGNEGFFLCQDKLISIEDFDLSRHQSAENFGVSGSPYYNNFLFLHKDRVASGQYRSLFNTSARQ